MKSLLLDTQAWDLVKDVSGNIALASDPYALAQNAASAVRLFKGELWYNTTLGIPYFESILGKAPNVPLMKTKLTTAAALVPGVATAKVFISSLEHRTARGQVQVTGSDGITAAAAF